MARRPQRPDVEPADNLGPLTMIAKAAAKYPRHVTLAGISLVVTAAATLAIPSGFRLIIDRGFAAGSDPAEIGRWFRYLLMIVMILAIGTGSRFYFVSTLGERVVADIRLAVQRNLLRQSPGFFEENSPNEISSRMTADTAQIDQVVGTTVSVALRNAIMVIGGTGYLLYLSPLMTSALVAVVVIIIPLMTLFGRRVRSVSRESQDRIADVGAMVSEVLGAMKIVQGFNQEGRERNRFAEAVERTFATARRRILLRSIMSVSRCWRSISIRIR